MARLPLLLLIVACGASAIRLETLPDDIDPGESAPLLANAPLAVRRALQGAEANAVDSLLEDARREGRELSTQELIISLLVTEAHSATECDTSCLSGLELLYRMLALVADTRFHDTLRWFEPWIASLDPESADALDHMSFLREIFDRAGERHDWVVSRILRSEAGSEMHGEAVIGLAQRARSAGEHPRARQLFGLALPLLGNHAKLADVSGLARACYVVLDFDCGDAALARLERIAGSSEERARVEAARNAARTVARDARGLEERLARADALALLQRNADATQLYHALADDHPDDARPHIGLAQMVFARHGMQLFVPSNEGTAANRELHGHLLDASQRSHRDLTYYGLSMLSWNFRVLAQATRSAMDRARSESEPLFDRATVRGFREQLNALSDDFRALDEGTATAFRALGEFQLDVMSRVADDSQDMATLVAPLVPRVRTQLDASPENVAIYRVAILISMLTTDDAFITRALAVQPPTTADPEPTAVARGRASLLIGLRSRQPNRIVAGSGDPETEALVRWARADESDEVSAAAELESLVESASPESRARVLNNAAVARHRTGDASRARELIADARHEDGWDVLLYNRLALTPDSERDARWEERLTQLTEPTSRSAVRLQAARLLSHRAGSPHANLAEASAVVGRDRMPEQAAFVDGYQVGIGYTKSAGITTSGTTPLPWLLIEAPN